ncbi:MAG TPA: hypothetical protein VLT36_07065, partial [Candidatus Dormibacteraeota bacterium]|nr:hypothetical protein [Candidatus Dormibacteraeota bacterium]
ERDCIAMFSACREPDFREETSSFFVCSFYCVDGQSIRALADKHHANECDRIGRLLRLSKQLESLVADAYGVSKEAEEYLGALFGPQPLEYPKPDAEKKTRIKTLIQKPVADVIQEAIASGTTGRFITIKSYAADRLVEVVSHVTQANAADVLRSVLENGPPFAHLQSTARQVFGYSFGCAFGRWDITFATGERAIPQMPETFAPLPVCPPGMLQNAQGLPARPPGQISSDSAWNPSDPLVKTAPWVTMRFRPMWWKIRFSWRRG